MKGHTATLPNGEAVIYIDRKRWFWVMSLLYPLQPFVGIALHSTTGNELWLLLPLLLNYGFGSILDALLGVDRNNPPEEVVMKLDRDRYYRWLTFAVVPIHYFTLIGCAWYAATEPGL